MKCLDDKQLMEYLDDELTDLEKKAVEAHIAVCGTCRLNLQKDRIDFEFFDSMVPPLPLPASFEKDVMVHLLSTFPKQEQESKPNRETTKVDWKNVWKRSFDVMKKVTIAAASIVFLITLGVYTSPTFANYVKTFFGNNERIDEGIRNSANQGFTTVSDRKVEDKGISLIVKEVLADPSRVAVLYSLQKQDGTPIMLEGLGDTDNPEERNTVYITDTDGNVLTPPEEGGYQTENIYPDTLLEFELSFFKALQKMPAQIILHVEFNQIGTTKGTWKLQIPIDTQKNKTATKKIQLNKETLTPAGIKITWKEIKFTPSSTHITLQTEMTPERQEIIKKLTGAEEPVIPKPGQKIEQQFDLVSHYANDYGLAYRLVGENGATVAVWDEDDVRKLSNEKNVLLTNSSKEKEGMFGVTTENHFFLPSKQTGKLTLEPQAVYIKEPANFTTTLPLNDLEKKPLRLEQAGNTYTFRNFRLKTDDRKEKTESGVLKTQGGIVEINAELATNVTTLGPWKAKDDKGTEYGVKSLVTVENGKDGKRHLKGILFFTDMKNKPKHLELELSLVGKKYPITGVSIPILPE